MSFDAIRGHEAVLTGLREALRTGRVPNAWLFVGPAGVGKRTVMHATAQALLCERETENACGACGACRRFEHSNHPDYLELTISGEQVAVEAMRRFCREAGLRPVEGQRRVCAVPDADRMTDAAANCFLKTLEEPPGAGVLLLRAESTDRLLSTVVSRCQVVRLGPLPTATVRDALVRDGMESSIAADLAVLSEGAIGRALALAEESVSADWAWITEAIDGVRPGDALSFAEGLVERAGSGNGAQVRARSLELLDLLALAIRRRVRSGAPPRAGLKQLEAVWQAAEALQKNVTPALVLEALAMDLAAA